MRKSLTGIVFFLAVFYLSFWYVSDVGGEVDMGIDVEINETILFEINEDWLTTAESETYSADCKVSQDEDLYVERQGTCVWTSEEYNTSNYLGKPNSITTAADIRNGNGNLTVRTFVGGSLNESFEFELEDGVTERNLSDDFTYDDVDAVDTQIELVDNGSTSDQLPSINNYDLRLDEENATEKRGLTGRDAQVLTMVVFVFTGLITLLKLFG